MDFTTQSANPIKSYLSSTNSAFSGKVDSPESWITLGACALLLGIFIFVSVLYARPKNQRVAGSSQKNV